MKIMFLARSLGLGGAERQLIELASALHRRGHDVSVAVFYTGHPLDVDLERVGVPLHDLGKRGRWDLSGFAARMLRLIRTERPDVLHSYLTVPNILAAISAPLLQPTAIVWGVRASNLNIEHYDWLTSLTERAGVLLARRTDRIIVNSQAGFRHHVRLGHPESKMRVIENGIDTQRFRRDPRQGGALRRHWGVNSDEVLLGLVGRLDPMKGHLTFFEAASRIAAMDKKTRFVCAGGGGGGGKPEFAAELRRSADEFGLTDRLIWQEALPDPVPLYSALDCLCSASIFGEGFPNVVAEAMACEVPCVVTDVGDSARIVQCPRYVARPGDASSLFQAMVALLGDLASGHVDRAALRRRIVDDFSLEQLLVRTESTLAEVLASRDKPQTAPLR